MAWEVVIDHGAVEIAPGSALERRALSVAATLPGWRIAGLRWLKTARGKSYVAYIEREKPYCFIAPGAMRSPAAAVREAAKRASDHGPTPAVDGLGSTQGGSDAT